VSKSARFGAPQAGGPEQVQQREVAPAGGAAPVGHPQQARVLLGAERARLTARHPLAADVADALDHELGGEGA
jgi:hypothetical protein